MTILVGIVAGVVAFMLGALWYSVLFKKQWMEELGLTEEKVNEGDNGNVALLMVGSLIIEIAVSFLVLFIISKVQLFVLTAGAIIASISVLSALKNYIFEQKSLKLILINESYKFLCIMIMTVAFYLFR